MDKISVPILRLDREYGSMEFLDCDGVWRKDTVTLNHPIPAQNFYVGNGMAGFCFPPAKGARQRTSESIS